MSKTNMSAMSSVAYRVAGQDPSTADVIPLGLARAHAKMVEMETDPVERKIREAAERRRAMNETIRAKERQEEIERIKKQRRRMRYIQNTIDAVAMPLFNLFWIGCFWLWISNHWNIVDSIILFMVRIIRYFV